MVPSEPCLQWFHLLPVHKKQSHSLCAEYSGRQGCLTIAGLFRSHVAADQLTSSHVYKDKEGVTVPLAAEDSGQTRQVSH